MICPRCLNPKTSVTNSRRRQKEASTWRRRQCPNCSFTFTSEERPALDYATPVESNKISSNFSIGQLTLSIAKAFVHNPQKGRAAAYDLARSVEQQLLVSPDPLDSQLIRATTQDTLGRFDATAATVYAAQHGIELA